MRNRGCAAPLRSTAAVVAVPTSPADKPADSPAGPVAELQGASPVELDDLLTREKAKGEAGEVVAAPQPSEGSLERVLAVGVGDGSLGALRKAGAAAARRAEAAE